MPRLVHRSAQVARVTALLRQFPVVALLGARQVGKTTLARQVAASRRGPVAFFDLESSEDLARLADPMLALRDTTGLVVIDEVQRRPDLFATLRVLADAAVPRRRFLLLGSASPDLLQQGSETLAGRIAYHAIDGFSLAEVGVDTLGVRWQRGGFPRSFLARSHEESARWREEFVRTFLERDIPQLGLRIPAPALRRFWTMLAHYHAQTWNGSELARAFGVAHTTVQRYLDVLTHALVVRQLQPWHANLSKRQVRSPKVYLRDTGLLHTLLGIHRAGDLESHPKVGASWEGLALETVLAHLDARPDEAYFWGTQAGAELDLLFVRAQRRIGFEFKRTSSPTVTPSMRIALHDLALQRLYVVHGGRETFDMAPKIRAVPLSAVYSEIRVARR